MLSFVLDSGSMINVVPVDLVKKFGVQPYLSRTLLIKGAGGAKLAHFGRVIITLNVGEHSTKFCAEVAAVHRPLLSVGALLNFGTILKLEKNDSVLECKTHQDEQVVIPLEFAKGIFWLLGQCR